MSHLSLPVLEQHLEARLLELDKLHMERPNLPTAMARAEAGQRIDDLLDAIAELQRRPSGSSASHRRAAPERRAKMGVSDWKNVQDRVQPNGNDCHEMGLIGCGSRFPGRRPDE